MWLYSMKKNGQKQSGKTSKKKLIKRANGHLLLNGEKMSKSSGNFLTLRDAIDKFGADATRFALADSGDSIEDANFVESIANTATLRLYTEKEFCEETMKDIGNLRTGVLNWSDRVFLSVMQRIVGECDVAYEALLFREALKIGFYDLQFARNEYRKSLTGSDPTESYFLFYSFRDVLVMIKCTRM